MRRIPLHATLSAMAIAAATIGLATTGTGTASASATTAANPMPAHVFAPYYETYNTATAMVKQSQKSGAKYLSLAFLQTATAGSCTAFWNGSTSKPIAHSSFGLEIAKIQAAGGQVVPSFGGFTADSTGTDIADSCTNVASIAGVYEKVITTYNVTRIDLDIEANSLTNTDGINRRNEAVAMVDTWAKSHHRSIQFSYTLPTTTTGLDAQETPILQNAISDGATVSVVNLLTFDYFLGSTEEMATDTEQAATDTITELTSLYPSKTQAQLWAMLGVTDMPGIDDFGPQETFTKADATTVLNWAKSNGLGTLSIWAVQRDNGRCPGTKGAGACSGITQHQWFFSNLFEPFTR
ncbi:MAG TPA: hypothetical protein VGI74_22530 [Streptosporangiaceae bacterium]